MEAVEEVACYHPDITRDEASEILRQTRTQGAFLIRISESKLHAKVLSVLTDKASGTVSSYRLGETPGGNVYLAVKNDNIYSNLQQLITDYLSGKEVLPDNIKLVYPVANNDQPIYVHLPKDFKSLTINDKEKYSRRAKLVKDNVFDFVTCLICLEVADDAMETSCCHQIYCRECLSKMLNRPCPTCRQEFKMIISHTTRRIIGNLPASCPNAGCNVESTVSEIKVHERNCKFLLSTCPIPDCEVSCLKRDLGRHLMEAHENLVIRCVERCYLQPSDEECDSYVYTEPPAVTTSDENSRNSRGHEQEERSLQRASICVSRHGSNKQRNRRTQGSSAVSMEDEYDFANGQQELRLPQKETCPSEEEEEQYYCSQQGITSQRRRAPANRNVVHVRNIRGNGNNWTRAEEMYEIHKPIHNQQENRNAPGRAPASREYAYGYNQQRGGGIQRRPHVRDRDSHVSQEHRASQQALTTDFEDLYECIDDLNGIETDEHIYDVAL